MSKPSTQHHDLLFDIRRSVRYHSRREAYYDRFHSLVVLSSLLLGSATLVAFYSEFSSGWPLWLKLLPAAIVTVLAAMDTAVGSSQKARRHHDLMRDFIALECELVQMDSDDCTGDSLQRLTQRRLQIEADEPPVLKVLDTLCHNELLRAYGYDKKRGNYVEVNPLQRWFANWFDLNEQALQKSSEV